MTREGSDDIQALIAQIARQPEKELSQEKDRKPVANAGQDQSLVGVQPAEVADGDVVHQQRDVTGQHQRAEQQHHGRQPVQHQHDPVGRGPVAQQIQGDDVAPLDRRSARAVDQRHGHAQLQQAGHKADGQLQLPPAFVVHQHDRPGEQRHQDRHDKHVDRQRHGLRSFPSTWSVPVSPREAMMTTRNSAVVAKLMTMAVSTSAWGTGSA